MREMASRSQTKRDRVPGPEVLLCERCGYVLEGTPRDGVCAECGKPVVESLPERRVGSEWQRAQTFQAWRECAVALHKSPSAVWKALGITRADHHAAEYGCIAGTVPIACAYVLSARRADNGFQAILVGLFLVSFFTWLALYFLTWIEAKGVEFFSKRRGWRVPRSLAWAITSHASATWWVATTILSFGLWQADRLEHWANSAVPASMQAFVPLTGAIVPLAAFALGMLVFETLVYQGVRTCKFANVPTLAGVPRAKAAAETLPFDE